MFIRIGNTIINANKVTKIIYETDYNEGFYYEISVYTNEKHELSFSFNSEKEALKELDKIERILIGRPCVKNAYDED